MPRFRRYFLAGGPVFVTCVCRNRRPLLGSDSTKALLLDVMRDLRREIPYRMIGYVVLPDHFHWLLRLAAHRELPRLMQALKLRVSRRSGWGGVFWQRRYWDHHIRDAGDLRRHLDYVHYNPVKHGVVSSLEAYAWSSFHAYVARGVYPPGWGTVEPPAGAPPATARE